MRKALAALSVALWAFLYLAQPAGAFPQGEVPTVAKDCKSVEIDPPSWVKVTMSGTINGVPYEDTVFYNHTDHAVFDISARTATPGTYRFVLTATSPFLGTSPTIDVTVQCGEQPTTTTTSTTTVPEETSTVPTTVVTTPGELPRTGSSTGPFAFVGVACVVGGLLAARRRPVR